MQKWSYKEKSGVEGRKKCAEEEWRAAGRAGAWLAGCSRETTHCTTRQPNPLSEPASPAVCLTSCRPPPSRPVAQHPRPIVISAPNPPHPSPRRLGTTHNCLRSASLRSPDGFLYLPEDGLRLLRKGPLYGCSVSFLFVLCIYVKRKVYISALIVVY